MNLKDLGFGGFLEEGETIKAVFRHPLSNTLVKVIITIGMWGALAWAMYFYLSDYYYDYAINNAYSWLFLIPVFIGFYKAFNIFMRWYANAILMTSESLVFCYFVHAFDRKIHRIDYWDLDDVELEKKGVSDYLGNRGDLIFAKVSGGAPIEFKRVNNPRKIITTIRKHKAKMLNEKNFSEEGALKDLLSQLVQTHTRTKGQPEKAREFHQEIVQKNEHHETELTAEDFIRMREEELAKLKSEASYTNELNDNDDDDDEIIEDIPTDIPPSIDDNTAGSSSKNMSIHRIKKLITKKIPRHFHNELDDDNQKIEEDIRIEIEKELDDTGGLEIDLDDK